jgi:nucleoside-diphosphate-sugar epimerase
MVLARDVAAIALRAAQVGGTFNLTDGVHPTISALSRVIAIRSGCRIPRSIPNRLATLLAVLGDATGGRFPLSSARLANLRSELTFDDSLARSRLGWSPQTVLDGDWVTSSDVRSVEPLPR